MTQTNPRETSRPDFPAVVHTYTDALRFLRDFGPADASTIAEATQRVASNVKRDLPRLMSAEVISLSHGDRWMITDKGRQWVTGQDVAAGVMAAPSGEPGSPSAVGVLALRHDQILPDTNNARRDWDSAEAKAELQALSDDIAGDGADEAGNGLLQNLVVRLAGPDDLQGQTRSLWHHESGQERDYPLYRLIGGERRWRAIGLAINDGRWPETRLLPCRVLETDDLGHRLAGLAENLQRRNLNPIEKAKAYDGLAELGLTNAQIAAKVGVTPEHIQQHRRFLKLPPASQLLMTLPRDDSRHLSVRGARELLAHQAQREAKAAALASLPIAQRLIAGEAIHAIMARAEYSWADIKVQPEALADEQLAALTQDQWLFAAKPSQHNRNPGFHTVKRGHGLPHDLFTWAWTSDGQADAGLKALQAEADPAFAASEERPYITPWLNGPFEITPEGQALLDAKAEADKAQEEQRERNQALDAERKASAKTARVEATALVEKLKAATPPPVDAGIASSFDTLKHPLPWAVNDRAELIDAKGSKVLRVGDYYGPTGDREITIALLLAASVNAAGGAAIPDGPHVPDRGDFEKAMVAHLIGRRSELSQEEAATLATQILEEFLDNNCIDFGDPDEGDWSGSGAVELVGDWMDADDEEKAEAA